jgi:hypothetical protein
MSVRTEGRSFTRSRVGYTSRPTAGTGICRLGGRPLYFVWSRNILSV